jgi:sugar/nucleoside kinase (ribokinase family)
MAHLLIIGGASSDILHFAEQKVVSAGGAGMYTSMAAQRSGVQVSMFGPRPDPIPDQLKPVARYLTEWLGPSISSEEIPQFVISYEQGKTDYLKVKIDAEVNLSTSMLPADLSNYDLVHVTPLGNAERQLAFIQACKQRGSIQISAGTGLCNVAEQPRAVRAVFDESDYCFMNAEEAKAVYGSLDFAKTTPGKIFLSLSVRAVRG